MEDATVCTGTATGVIGAVGRNVLNSLSENAGNQLWPAMVEQNYVQRVRELVQKLVAPVADDVDERDYYPADVIRAFAREGCNAITLPQEYGGRGMPYAMAVALCEEIAASSAATAASLITIFQAQTMLNLFGDESIKRQYLPQFASGLISAYALTEQNHGSDIRRLDTKAQFNGDSWTLNGEKHFISAATEADFAIVLAEAERGVSAFAVPLKLEGIEIYEGRNSSTFGLRNGPHMNVRFKDVILPVNHLIGEEGRGVRQAVTVLDHSRTLAAAISIGIARAAFDGALAFASGRKVFDRRVLEFQGIQWYFADMLAEIDAARLLVYRTAEALQAHDNIALWGSAAKLKASSVATSVAVKAAQICGAYGIMKHAPFGRYIRDAKAYEIGGGSSEVLKNTIAKHLVQSASKAGARSG